MDRQRNLQTFSTEITTHSFLTSLCLLFELQSQARLFIFTLLGEVEVLMGRQLQLQFEGLHEIKNPVILIN